MKGQLIQGQPRDWKEWTGAWAPVCPHCRGRGRLWLFMVASGHVVRLSVSALFLPVFQGNSNNIATVDISAGFVGLDTYVEIPAIFLTAFATYAGPVLWASHLVSFLSSEASR